MNRTSASHQYTSFALNLSSVIVKPTLYGYLPLGCQRLDREGTDKRLYDYKRYRTKSVIEQNRPSRLPSGYENTHMKCCSPSRYGYVMRRCGFFLKQPLKAL